MSEWILFKKDDGRIGVLPIMAKKNVKGIILETVLGNFDTACSRAKFLEEESK